MCGLTENARFHPCDSCGHFISQKLTLQVVGLFYSPRLKVRLNTENVLVIVAGYDYPGIRLFLNQLRCENEIVNTSLEMHCGKSVTCIGCIQYGD